MKTTTTQYIQKDTTLPNGQESYMFGTEKWYHDVDTSQFHFFPTPLCVVCVLNTLILLLGVLNIANFPLSPHLAQQSSAVVSEVNLKKWTENFQEILFID